MPSPTASTPNTIAAPLSPPPPPPLLSAPNNWGPYSSAKDFDANMATVIIVLVCATAIAFALYAAFTFLIRRLRGSPPPSPSTADAGKPPAEAPPPSPQLPGPVVFSSGATPVAGAADCSICLAELAEGDRVRLLPFCGHGFHAQCIEAWLVGCRSSCPTCRTDCRPPSPAIAEP